ncbi:MULTISPECIES: hypothetical protein [unclassified Pseudodesulfovibrio]|uniref:hypothetical protein n=1 Tax=unclassified Pseudodesulfovibrio TaxID=2661612 RepID=UPI000FEC18B6|nr:MULTISPECIES: hypothetical protein [unclassified Pseudodesulfovibrio]MCJ2164009.1 hypothetical protein [Pseudodesulfovibrio sp. S3-i]RWU05354.1 hypothetical protein DWB63_06810 [Pseudodesulfovibrio sp. S3]
MPTSPDHATTADRSQREQTARFLLEYLNQIPMDMEKRLELALETLRSLPVDATPSQTLTALRSRLPTQDHEAFPHGYPPIDRWHMPAQYLGRSRSGMRALASQWAWLTIIGLLLAMTLLLHVYK